MIDFANELVEEREIDRDLGILLDTKQNLESETSWLASKLVSIEKQEQVSVVAEVEGSIVANSEVQRGKMNDEFYHGKLGIAISKEWRSLGLGREMMKTLLQESKKMGLKTVELEVFSKNERARHLYEKTGFKQVGVIPKKVFRNGTSYDIILMYCEL